MKVSIGPHSLVVSQPAPPLQALELEVRQQRLRELERMQHRREFEDEVGCTPSHHHS